MATGDQTDMLSRLRALLPRAWVPDRSPILDGFLSGPASALAHIASLIAYARLQTRIKTATDGWLDLIAFDFFGYKVRRSAGQNDDTFRTRIILEMFRERGNRAGLRQVLIDLTGRVPWIFEPTNPTDTGAYRTNTIGYGMPAGRYGSLNLPLQTFCIPLRPTGAGIPWIAGYGASQGGYGQASYAARASINQVTGTVKDSDIYTAIDGVKPAGSIIWTNIQTTMPFQFGGRLDNDF